MSKPSDVSPEVLQQQAAQYVGKQVLLFGKVDRILGGGAFVISDRKAVLSASQPNYQSKVLLFTSNYPGLQGDIHGSDVPNSLAALQEGDWVKVLGEVKTLEVTQTTGTVSAQGGSSTSSQSSNQNGVSLPVLVAKMEGVQKQAQ
jgi:hypothetical protein